MLKDKTLGHSFLYCIWTYFLNISLKKDDDKLSTVPSFDGYITMGQNQPLEPRWTYMLFQEN